MRRTAVRTSPSPTRRPTGDPGSRVDRAVATQPCTSPPCTPSHQPLAEAHRRATLLGHRPGGYSVQRNFYKTDTTALQVPQSYADTRIAWDAENGWARNRPANESDPKLGDLVTASETKQRFLGYLASAIGHPVSRMTVLTTQEAQAAILGMLPPKQKMSTTDYQDAYRKPAGRLFTLFKDPKRFVVVPQPYPIYSKDMIESEWALLPKDMVPERRDLPATGESVTEKPNGVETAWNLVCSLIALIKAEGDDSYTKAKSVSKNQDIDSLETAVQALHDHYMGKETPFEYDDTSTHLTLMQAWGYKLLFTGPVAWTELHKHFKMKKDDTYVVDIHGHTVMMTVKKKPPKKDTDLDKETAAEYYEFHSDEDNYEKAEIDQPVEYIYKK